MIKIPCDHNSAAAGRGRLGGAHPAAFHTGRACPAAFHTRRACPAAAPG